MKWAYFREAFKREFFEADVLYAKAQEYHKLRHKDIIVKEFSTKLN